MMGKIDYIRRRVYTRKREKKSRISIMGGGNGCKSQQKRERNLKNAQKGGKSQLASNQQCQTIQCKVCFVRTPDHFPSFTQTN